MPGMPLPPGMGMLQAMGMIGAPAPPGMPVPMEPPGLSQEEQLKMAQQRAAMMLQQEERVKQQVACLRGGWLNAAGFLPVCMLVFSPFSSRCYLGHQRLSYLQFDFIKKLKGITLKLINHIFNVFITK